MTASTITLRLIIQDPVPGVTYSLQDPKNTPVDPVVASEAPLAFDLAVQVAEGPRFRGPFVRREGKERQFVYIAIGTQAGDPGSPWSRRGKVDIHDLSPALLEVALRGTVLEARLPGRDGKGGPACATLRPLGGWQAAGEAASHQPRT
ncbi:DUF5990 family protein [Aquabacter sp. P-9]|uniref:DUF5990 family protein n=1 Tax=Aquabacter sediminis TaxID=3029197 RepID=UPI00237ECB18|nr:DUF5990 family protein [Aquabacter sp. P-9]MDE1570971.1 DUF5990 family protein [Aquabacter sp. P-9]